MGSQLFPAFLLSLFINFRSRFLIQKFHHRLTEGRKVARRAAGNQVAVHDYRFIHPDAAGIFQIVLDAREPVTRLPFRILAEIGIQPPWQMKATSLPCSKNSRVSDSTFASRRNLSGMKPPGTSRPQKSSLRASFNSKSDCGGIAVLAGVGFDFRRGAFQRVTGLLQSQFRIPQLQVFINVIQKRENSFIFCHDAHNP